ncbi:MAG TPA: hypothetical protein VM120_26990 [Bryobacteraceae bacterium]|nr:hypothetical protein [Bryobacteraceae bacterium]
MQPILAEETHVVSLAELHQEVVSAARARQRNLDAINGFLTAPQATKALRTAGIELDQAKIAISALNDQELTRLAERSRAVQADLLAGRLSDRDLLVVLLGIAALILIIVAVR